MSVVATSTAKKGEVVLLPNFFTSNLYVDPLRDDIRALVNEFFQAWSRDYEGGKPFSVFQDVWKVMGWPWMHFKTLEARSRERFLGVTLRLFLERAINSEQPFTRATMLFALYTFFMTQPTVQAPPILRQNFVDIPIDVYRSLMQLPAALTDATLLPFRDQTVYIMSILLDKQVFRILPPTSAFAQNPRELPRELYVDQAMGVLAGVLPEPSAGKQKKKAGRPSKREQNRRAKIELDALKQWLDQTDPDFSHAPAADQTSPISPPLATANTYRELKRSLIEALIPENDDATTASNREAVITANQRVLERLRRIDALAAERGLEVGGAGGVHTGLIRVESAVRELQEQRGAGQRAGLLSMSEGAGLSDST